MFMNKFMKIAINEAKKGIKNNHGGPFGACIVKNNEVIAVGHNKVVKTKDPTCHGEIDAIRKASKKLNSFNLKGCTLYTTGQPCPMCACACLWANIDKVYYGCTQKDIDMIGFKDDVLYKIFKLNSPKNYFEQMDRTECLKLFYEYMNLSNKTSY